MAETIAPATAIGEVQVYVSDLARAVDFYTQSLGFHRIDEKSRQARLGAGGQALVVLNERPGARIARGTTGLYHFAVRLPDRKSLARLLFHLAESETGVQGASDHGVSEALYLADLDGIGIELYRDRQRREWPVDDIGRIQMGTEELDIDDLVMELQGGVAPWTGLPDGTTIGHVHLHVSNLLEAEQFYTGVLGFQLMMRYGSGAIFVSAGGYHHHIGLNTWAGEGAPPPPQDAAGLRWFEVRLPDQTAMDALVGRLQSSDRSYEMHDGGILTQDPSHNQILFSTSG